MRVSETAAPVPNTRTCLEISLYDMTIVLPKIPWPFVDSMFKSLQKPLNTFRKHIVNSVHTAVAQMSSGFALALGFVAHM
jgi:hypothetical protein